MNFASDSPGAPERRDRRKTLRGVRGEARSGYEGGIGFDQMMDWGAILALVGLAFGAGVWYTKVNADRKTFNKFMDEIRGMFGQILNEISADRITKRSSPIQLTALGEQMAEFLEAREWAAKLAPTLREQVPEAPFEIDDFAASYVKERRADWERRIAACAFRFGVEREDVPIVLRVALRDALLSFED